MTRQTITLGCMMLTYDGDRGYLWDIAHLSIPATKQNRTLLSTHAVQNEAGEWLACVNDVQLWLQLPGVARA